MSWTKQPQGGQPPPAPERPPYAAPQPQQYNNQQTLYQNYHPAPANTQQQFWPQQQPPVNQQYGQVYQQDYPGNANQFYPPQNQYNQNYNQFNNPQQGYQQNYYQNQPAQQQNFGQKPNSDAWEDNWDWGWDEAAKQQAQKQQNMVSHQANSQQLPINNANVLEESFATTDNWNWSMDDKKDTNIVDQRQPVTEVVAPATNAPVDNNPQSEHASHTAQQVEDVKTLNDREVIKEKLPNLALGKRFHLDNLTPQWSIESQMSQEFSDGPQTHSESTYRSENQSRNSSKSSPGPNTDSSNFNYSHPAFDEYPNNSEWSKSEESTLTQAVQNGSRRESQDELASSIQGMNLGNHETLTEPIQEPRPIQEIPVLQPPPAITPTNFPAPMPTNHLLPTHNMPPAPPVHPGNVPPPSSIALPRPPSSSGSIPRPPSSSGSLPRPPSSSSSLPPVTSAGLTPPSISAVSLPPPSSGNAAALTANLPPPNFPPPTSSSNPFKHAGAFSHKTTTKPNNTPMQFTPQMPNNLTAPAVVSKVSQQQRVPLGFEANLETTPDNSERPDQPHMSLFRPSPVAQLAPENLEVAPQNDRNEYLQTAHLSSSDYGENTDFSRNLSLPGVRRMGVGQQENEYSQNLNISNDEPPPSFARMVPGQQTEAENVYNQPGSNYLDRQIDGQPTDGSTRPNRQADGQQTPNNYAQPLANTAHERRPVGLDRMVPGEPSNDEYPQYQLPNYGANEQRVVTGVDHDFSMPSDAGPTDIREQNVDGSDYTDQGTRNAPRNIIGARDSSNAVSPDFGALPDDHQREIVMEGENLQDLSVISSAELTYSREQIMDGHDAASAETHKAGPERKIDHSEAIEHPVTSSRRQSVNRITSGEESERDRAFKSSPRRDRDKHKSSRDRDRDRDRERDREKDKEGRYSRGDRKYDREERRSGRDDRRPEKERRDRRERDDSPDARRHRRSTRAHRYETEDTDYYSDKERERRRYREGSYASRPPRREDKDRRGDDRDRTRRYNTIERDRRYEDEWDGASRSRRGPQHLRYRDIDASKKYGSLRKERDDDRRRVVTFSSDANANDSKHEGEQYSSPSRPDSREHTATDEDVTESRRRTRRHPRPDPYYDGGGYPSGGGYQEAYSLQPAQYQYYELLRVTDPEAYMQVYKQLMAGHAPPPPPPHLYSKLLRDVYGEGYGAYEGRLDKHGLHSGRSSATPLKGTDTDLNTDASLNLQLEESTVRSERMTPFRFATAHIKGSISSRDVVVVRPSYPVDGQPARVQLLALAALTAHDPAARELNNYPGPLVKGVTHKKSVIDYCMSQIRSAASEPDAAKDLTGYVLLWDLLALLLRQNGVVVGSDIAELLMKNTKEYEYRPNTAKASPHDESRRESSMSGEPQESADAVPAQHPAMEPTQSEMNASTQAPVDEKAALDELREHLIYGNRQEALECAMRAGLWGHALQLAAHSDRRTRSAVHARFLAALPRADPLRTLYCALAGNCVIEENCDDWRPHAAILLSNTSARPDNDRRTLTQLGDRLVSRGLIYSAQFCWVSAGVQFGAHPLAPLAAPPPGDTSPPAPRLSLLLADPSARTLAHFATNKAIFATEIYEYAMSLSQEYVIPDLQAYKVVASARLCDCGQYARALAYTEQAARALTQRPDLYPGRLAQAIAHLADRLKYHDPALQEDPPLMEEADSAEPSPRHQHQWLHDVQHLAHQLTEQSRQVTPQHHQAEIQPQEYQHQYSAWPQQVQQQYAQPVPAYPEPVEEPPEPAPQLYDPAIHQLQHSPQAGQQLVHHEPERALAGYGDEWNGAEEQHAHSYGDPYWHGDASYGYGEGEGEGEPRPQITMPAAAHHSLHADATPPPEQQEELMADSASHRRAEPKQKEEQQKAEGAKGRSGWLGGILTKLSLRPPNQMILPDDKNPSIVWDEDKKRWRNMDGDADEDERPPAPPPRVTPLAQRNGSPPLQSAPAPGAPPAAPVSNIFKMQKGRHIKKSYVDVFNPSGAATRALPPAAEVLGPALDTFAPVSYLVPAPTPAQSGFYDPTQMGNDADQYRSGI